MWLQDAESDDVAEGVFAREDIEAGTFLLDFGELRLATAIESSGQWCGWRLRFDIESKLSTVTKTFVVKGQAQGARLDLADQLARMQC
jgi:hypothetical protein